MILIKERNDAYEDKTTKLAAYLKFGCVSPREVYHTIATTHSKNHMLLSELMWREFYFHLTFHQPRLLARQIDPETPNEALRTRMATVKWKHPEGKGWIAWCEGKTGFPLVIVFTNWRLTRE